MIDCVHQTGPRKGVYPAVCYPHARCLPSESQWTAWLVPWRLRLFHPVLIMLTTHNTVRR